MKPHLLLAVMLCICSFVPGMFAQSAPQPSLSEGWRVEATPYLWGSSFKGRVGIGDRSADVDASFADLFRELNFGFTAFVAANRDKFTTVTDIIYLNLSDERATPGPLFSSLDAVDKTFILSPTAGYRIAGSNDSNIDVLGGIRFWHVKGELKFEPGILGRLDLSDSRNWVDGIFALKGKRRLSPTWYLTGYGDIGGGGSNLAYQLVGIAGADIRNWFGLVFGYRYLNVDYNKDRFLFDTGMGGPVIGLTFKF
jgi:hypothetical protein